MWCVKMIPWLRTRAVKIVGGAVLLSVGIFVILRILTDHFGFAIPSNIVSLITIWPILIVPGRLMNEAKVENNVVPTLAVSAGAITRLLIWNMAQLSLTFVVALMMLGRAEPDNTLMLVLAVLGLGLSVFLHTRIVHILKRSRHLSE